jgi:hypothetical protein
MPVYSELMNTITIRKICQLTPIAALPVKPTTWPTIAWSTMPCAPPIAFWSMAGQARCQTAAVKGPSMMRRSKRCRGADARGGAMRALPL